MSITAENLDDRVHGDAREQRDPETCAQCVTRKEKRMTITSAQMELRQRREATIREHIDAENHHDPNRAVATFSSYRASYDVPSMGEAGQPADANAVRAMWVGIITAFPDIHIVPGPLYHGDNHIFVEVRMTGTQPEWPACMSSRRTSWCASGSTSTSLASCANSACYLCEAFQCRAKEIVGRDLSLCSAKLGHNRLIPKFTFCYTT